jgi:hypothetical protein
MKTFFNKIAGKIIYKLLTIKFFFIIILIPTVQISYAASLYLTWDANTEPDLAGYKVYYRTSFSGYFTSIDVGDITEYELSNPSEGLSYYIIIVLTAYDSSDNESEISNMVCARFDQSFNSDNDCDGISNSEDNCPYVHNPGQEDLDEDDVGDVCDNCQHQPNSPDLGTCVIPYGFNGLVVSYREGDPKEFITCTDNDPCTLPDAYCQKSQGDWNGNGCGDVCECYADGSGASGVPDGNINASDFGILKQDWGRDDCAVSICQGDFNEDDLVNTWDNRILNLQWGLNDCPACE